MAAFQAEQHGWPGAEALLRQNLGGAHPHMRAELMTVATDGGRIVSATIPIPQTWAYEGIEFPVLRTEFVATHPDYRRRGLVRRQFEMIHARFGAEGTNVFTVNGAYWYYRQFGYEMGLRVGGVRSYGLDDLATGPLRDSHRATAADLPAFLHLTRPRPERWPLECVRDASMAFFEIAEPRNLHPTDVRIFQGGQAVTQSGLYGGTVYLNVCEIADGESWSAWAVPLLTSVRDTVPPGEFKGWMLALGATHPIFDHLPDRPLAEHRPWYVRVADVPAFLRLIRKPLERRLAVSARAGHSGRLRISFFRSGVELHFDRGTITEIEAFPAQLPDHPDDGDCTFPDHTFLQLLFGCRSLADLRYAFADCTVDDEVTRELLEALFPRRPTHLRPF
jgi:hypothetical protein